MMNTIIDNLNWRYATKQFDATQKLSKDQLDTFLEAGRLTASSYGLQPYHFFVVENHEVREKLKAASYGQTQITDASHLIILANNPSFDESLVDTYIDRIVEVRGVSKKNLEGYEQMMKGSLLGLPDDVKNNWSAKQAYIVLGNLLTVAAQMKIDTCPIEGFDKAQYDEILGLKEKNLTAALVLPVGFRAKDDQTQHYPKVRYAKEKITTHI